MGFDAVVVGGGISGVVAARRLELEGARVALVEASPKLGGLVSTIHDDGYLIEMGPDSFVAAKGSVLRLAQELGIGHEVISNRSEAHGSYVWWDGRLHPLPGGMLLMVPYRLWPLLTSSLLSWRAKARVLGDLFIPRADENDDESLESFVRRRLGDEVLDRIAQPLVAGIHAAEPGTMSLRASFPRFLEMEHTRRSLILAARALPKPRTGPDTSHFASFRLGMGQLIAALTGALRDVDVRTGETVTSIAGSRAGGYKVGLGDGSQMIAQAVVCATPAPVASRLLGDLAPRAASALGGIEQVGGAVVTFAYRSEQLPRLAGSGFVVPSAQRRGISGVSYSSHKWAGRVPDEGHALIRVFPTERSSAASGRDPDTLTAMVTEELEAMTGITAPPVRSWVSIRRAGLHRYTLGHLDRVKAAETALSRRLGIALAGAGFHGIGLNECIDSGERAAYLLADSTRVDSSSRSGAGH